MKKAGFILFIGFLFLSFSTSKNIELLIEKEIKANFEIEAYTKKPINISREISESLPLKITESNFYAITNDSKTIGYYYLGQAFGKADYFDFIVIFDAELLVSKVKVLVYREDHGGEVKSKRWLKQFIGKKKNDNLTYQKDIAAISGATISAKSMTYEINKLLKTVFILNDKNIF